ncbi:hypothetical protein GW17_00036473 [Ensete ventricosum]|nr:hypothetical protein GW17_00036473 [Ensete ventricosum]
MIHWIGKLSFILLGVASVTLVADLLLPCFLDFFLSLRHLWIISQFIVFFIWKLSSTGDADESLELSFLRPLAADSPDTWCDVPSAGHFTSFPSRAGSREPEPLLPEVTKEMVEPRQQYHRKEAAPLVVKEEAMGWRRREVLMVNHDELFQRAEVFIKKHYDSLRLQPQEEYSEQRQRLAMFPLSS